MIFNELYSAYYNTVSKIVSAVIKGETNEKKLEQIVKENAFGESMFSILPSIKSEKWKIIQSDFSTPLNHEPIMPLTLMQKQWLKAISLDPRIKLFDIEFEGLDDIQPLFTSNDYYIYDKYSDGDPYHDERYIKRFRTILSAIENKQNLKIEMVNRKGKTVYVRCIPEKVEYSEKDDKFRLVTSGCGFVKTVNIARITKCKIYKGDTQIVSEPQKDNYEMLILKVTEERNTLERSLLHFAHFEKRVEKFEDYYLLHIKYSCDDEPEMVIRVLSFGPTVEVVGNENFKQLIINKLKSQKSCELF